MKKLSLSHRNIRLRYFAELEKDPQMSLKIMAERLGTDKQLFWRWTSRNKFSCLPNSRICPWCNKTMAQFVTDWINDGTLDEAMVKKLLKSYMKKIY